MLDKGRKLTEAEFMASYAAESSSTIEALKKYFVALPCCCGADICQGWAMVPNRPEHIEMHNRRYKPAAPATRKDFPSLPRVTGEALYVTYSRSIQGTPWKSLPYQAVWNDWADRVNAYLAASTGEPIQEAKE